MTLMMVVLLVVVPVKLAGNALHCSAIVIGLFTGQALNACICCLPVPSPNHRPDSGG